MSGVQGLNITTNQPLNNQTIASNSDNLKNDPINNATNVQNHQEEEHLSDFSDFSD